MNNQDLNNDEIRRQLRAVDRMNTAVVPRWREALARLIGDDQLSTNDKATLARCSVAQPPRPVQVRWRDDPRRRCAGRMRQ